MEVKIRKKDIREKIQSFRGTLTADEKAAMNQKLFANFIALYQQELFSWNCLYTYVSTHQEADTRRIISFFLEQGKAVAVPRVRGKQMDFHYITSLEGLIPGYMGILEPDIRALKADNTGLCLVPGLAFDQKGFRIGYGGGYYDRFLQTFSGPAIGICHEWQMTDDLPKEAFDVPVVKIVTDKQIHSARGD